MEQNKDRLSIKAAKLYYESNFGQQQIAEKLQISRPTVSRLLQYAKDKGYVKITIIDPLENNSHLEGQLQEKYNLDNVKVVYSPLDSYEEIQKAIAVKGAEYLQSIVRDGDIIGVSWGHTLYGLAQCLQPQQVKNVQVVQLKGGLSHSQTNTYAYEVVDLFSEAFNTIGRFLPLPVMVDTVALKNLIEQDKHIKDILDLGKQSNIAVFTVGAVKDDALLFRLGYIGDQERNILKNKAVGDLCSHFYDAKGKICDKDLDARTLGIELAALKEKEKRILVAGSRRKLTAIKAALIGGYANVLITDQFTAKALLEAK